MSHEERIPDASDPAALRALASRALASMDWALARRCLTAYVAAVPDDVRAQLELATVLDVLGARGEAAAAFRRVIERSASAARREQRAEAALRLSWLLWNDLETEPAMGLLHGVLDSDLPAGSSWRVRASLALAVQYASAGDHAGAAELIETVEALSGSIDMDCVAALLEAKALVHLLTAQTGSAMHFMELASQLASKQHDALATRNKLHLSGYVAQLHGSIREARDRYAAAAEFARTSNLAGEVPFEQLSAAWASFTLGEVGEAADLVAHAYRAEHLREESRLKRGWVGVIVGLARGDETLARRAFEELDLDAAFRTREPSKIGPSVTASHQWLRRTGRVAEAAVLLARGVEALSSIEMAWCLVAEVAGFGRPDDVARLDTLLQTYAPQHTVSSAHRALLGALVARRRGEVAATARLAREAEAAFRACEWNYYAAGCVELSGRSEDARRMYHAMGAHGDAVRLETVRGKRGRPRRRGESSAASDWETACLVVSGATNKAIADQLGLSVRAVEQRLQKIYESAGAANRAELSTLIARGWTPR